MKKIHVFAGISAEEQEKLKKCLNCTVTKYGANETIMSYSEGTDKIGILLSGSAHLYCIDKDGNYIFIDKFTDGDIFGSLFTHISEKFEYIVSTDEDCSILFMRAAKAAYHCRNVCPYHIRFTENLMFAICEKSRALSLHNSFLNRRNIREKITAYLEYLKSVKGRSEFKLPMTLSDTAKYLCVDRSAMARELSKMKKEGLIKSNGNRFVLFF